MRFSAFPLTILALSASSLAQYSDQIIMYDPTHDSQTITPLSRPQPNLADLLTIDPSVSIFYSYLRETGMVTRLEDTQGSTTVLAARNRAVMALPVKPHQDSPTIQEGVIISEEQFDNISKQNVERWISAHIIPSAFDIATGSFKTLLGGKNVTFTDTKQESSAPEWARFVVDDDVKIVDRKEAFNGVLYVIDGTIKTA